MGNCCMRTDGVTILERLEDIRDNVDIVVAVHPTNEYKILERISDKLTDIILELKKKGGK